MSSSRPGARTGGERERCRYSPGWKARIPHVYKEALYTLLVYPVCAFSDGCAAADTTFDRALVHMYLIRVFANNTNNIHCKPYKMSSSQRDQ